MNIRLYTYLCFLFFTSVDLARGSDPVVLFAQQLVARAQKVDDDYWESERGGGYIFRFDYDVSGDGIPEHFLASSFMMGSNPRTEPTWTVFHRVDTGELRTLATGLQLSPDGFSVSKTPEGVRIFHWIALERRGEWALSYYEFHADGSFREIPEPTPGKQDQGVRVSPVVEKILLGEYLRNPRSPWRPYAHQFACYQQINDPSDASALETIKPLPLKVAEQTIAALAPVSPLVPIPTPAASSVAAKPQVPAATAQWGAPLRSWVLGFAALAVIGFFVWKRRS